jgi:hypothetical protein
MRGVITGKDVIRHSATIVRLWGWASWFNCLQAAFSRKPSTFLGVLSPVLLPTAAPGTGREHHRSARALHAPVARETTT